MKRIINGLPRLKTSLFILGAILALLINCFPIPFIYSDQIFLGNSIAIALTILYGLRVGLPISIASGLLTSYFWGHYLGILPFTIEIILVSLAVRYGKSVLLTGLLFWLTLGPVVIFANYFYFSDFSTIETYSISLKYSLNGLFNILLGYLIFHALRYLKFEPNIQFRTSTAQVILNTGFFIAFSISSVTVYFWLQAMNKELTDEIKRDTVILNEVVDDSVNNHLSTHLSAIHFISEIITQRNSNLSLDDLLEITGTLYPSYLTMLATDIEGNIIATWPAEMLEIAKINNTTNVSERDYFIVSKETSRAYISDSFQGQGFGTDPILALVVPYYLNNSFSGIIEGSLNLKSLYSHWIPEIDRNDVYIISDKQNSVVFASPELKIAPLTKASDFLLSGSDISSPTRVTVTSNGEEYIGYRTLNRSSGWSTISFIPIDTYESVLSGYMLRSFLLLLTMSFLFGIPLYFIAGALTKPISKLVENIELANTSKGVVPLESSSHYYVAELESLRTGYHRFTKDLAKTLANLTQSTEENKTLNQHLVEINENLERHVYERTEQLELALSSVSAANDMKSIFMANMSHEIRTPLHGVIGITEILLHQEHSEEVHQQLLLIQENGKHLLDLLNDILDFSKIESGTLSIHNTRVDVRECLSGIANTFKPIAEKKNLRFKLEIHKSVPDYLNLDAIRVKQILSNLISNAIKFTNTGSVNVDVFYEQACLHIKVIDTGIGISPNDIEQIYLPFQQLESSASKRFEGTGLGLAICMQLAKLMGAKLDCQSEVGVGTTFEFTVCSDDL